MEIVYSSKEAQFHTQTLTPAHVYVGMNDWSNILKDMEEGKFPVGTGRPFPVNFDKENDTPDMKSLSPWIAQQTDMSYNPTPIGPADLMGVGF